MEGAAYMEVEGEARALIGGADGEQKVEVSQALALVLREKGKAIQEAIPEIKILNEP